LTTIILRTNIYSPTHTHTCVTIHDNALSLDAIACTLGGALVPTQCAVCVSPPPRPLRVGYMPMPVQCVSPPPRPLRVGYISTQCVIPPPRSLRVGYISVVPLCVGYIRYMTAMPSCVGYIRYMSVTSVTPLDTPPHVSYILGTGGVTTVYTHPVSVSMYHGTIPVPYRYRKSTEVDLS